MVSRPVEGQSARQCPEDPAGYLQLLKPAFELAPVPSIASTAVHGTLGLQAAQQILNDAEKLVIAHDHDSTHIQDQGVIRR